MNASDWLAAPPKKARIEIIPLIDVIFFLLATFVLFTLSLQKMRNLDLQLPKAPDRVAEDFTTLHLQATEHGAYYLKVGTRGTAELVGAAELRGRIERYRESVAEPRVFIRTDRHARFGEGVFALDQVRLAGIKQVAVETVASAPGS